MGTPLVPTGSGQEFYSSSRPAIKWNPMVTLLVPTGSGPELHSSSRPAIKWNPMGTLLAQGSIFQYTCYIRVSHVYVCAETE